MPPPPASAVSGVMASTQVPWVARRMPKRRPGAPARRRSASASPSGRVAVRQAAASARHRLAVQARAGFEQVADALGVARRARQAEQRRGAAADQADAQVGVEADDAVGQGLERGRRQLAAPGRPREGLVAPPASAIPSIARCRPPLGRRASARMRRRGSGRRRHCRARRVKKAWTGPARRHREGLRGALRILQSASDKRRATRSDGPKARLRKAKLPGPGGSRCQTPQ